MHKSGLQTAAREALTSAGLTAGAEAFDTGTGLADRYDLLVCAVVPAGDEYNDRAVARVVVDALNAVRDIAMGSDDRVSAVSLRLTDNEATQDELNTWCRGDVRTLGLSDGALELVSVQPKRAEHASADFAVPYSEVELLEP